MSERTALDRCLVALVLWLLAMAALSGCYGRLRPMSREQVIAACNQCWDAGMDAHLVASMLDNSIIDVQCVPKDKP